MRKPYFSSGAWNALCDVCGVKRKSTEMQQRWDGLMVCRPTIKVGCWEPRHPQELIRPIPDNPPLPWTRPEPADEFIDTSGFILSYCTPLGMEGIAGYAMAGCAICGPTPGGL